MFINKKKTALLIFIVALSVGLQNAKAQLFYANLEGSQIKISGTNNGNQLKTITNSFTCDGNFTMANGELQKISSLNFSLPLNLQKKDQLLIEASALNTTKPTDDINFELTHAMVLPMMSMVHLIGYLDIEGVRNRVDFQFDFIENDNETITILGKKAIKLGDFKKGNINVFADAKAEDKILLDFKLVLKSPAKVDYFAFLTNKPK